MDNEDKVTRAILIIVCLVAIAPLVIAALIEIAAHELRCVSGRTHLKLLIRSQSARQRELLRGSECESPER